MSSKAVRTYRLVLFASQFAVSTEFLDRLSHSLQKLPTITDEETRIRIIEYLRTIIDDFRETHAGMSPELKLASRTTRAFINRFFALLGLLTTATSLKKIIQNIKTPLKTHLVLADLKDPAKYASSTALLTSAFPLLHTKISAQTETGFALSALALSFFPEGYPKDYAAIYALIQGSEALIKKHAYLFPLQSKSYWFLMPLCISQLLGQATNSPDYLPGVISRLFDALYSGLIETKPVWYNGEWPKTIDAFVKIKRARYISRGILHEKVEISRTNPMHVNAKFAVMSPSETNIGVVLKNHLPKKAFYTFVLTLPLFYLYHRYTKGQGSISSDSSSANPSSSVLSTSAGTSCQDDYEEVDDINADIITKLDDSTIDQSKQLESSTSPVVYSPLPSGPSTTTSISPLQRAVISSGKFTATTLATVITSYLLFTTRLSPRVNGLISGLWFATYKTSTSGNVLFAYLARITLLATFKQKRDALSRSKNSLFQTVGDWGATTVGALAISLLLKMHGEGRLSGRFAKYTQFLKSGGGVVDEVQ